jgi:hypothetical protein
VGDGTTGGQGVAVYGNTIRIADTTASASSSEGAVILVTDISAEVIVGGSIVKGATHNYAVTIGGTAQRVNVSGAHNETGLLGASSTVAGSNASPNRVPGGNTRAPTLTGVANVSATSAREPSPTSGGADVVEV